MKRLGRLIIWKRAQEYVERYRPTLIGVTGSSGKTIAKDAIALALNKTFRIRSAPGSYNTPIGVALSILGTTSAAAGKSWIRALVGSRLTELTQAEPDVIILELAADKPGTIDFLARKLPFTIGVVTNVQSAHLRLFGDKETVAHEKMSLIVDLPQQGFAILNADDPLTRAMREHTAAKVITFGRSQHATIRLTRVDRRGDQGFACEVLAAGTPHELHVPHLIAPYHIQHALAALACAHALDVDIKRAAQQLQELTPPPGRMRSLAGRNGSRLIDDSFNASPESTLAALETIKELPARRRIAILGDMLDLGGQTIAWHRDIGEHAAQVADVIVLVGQHMRHAGAAALATASVDVHEFHDSRDVGKWLADFLQEGDVVLIKGSRAMHMEEVTRRLLADPDKDRGQLVS